MTLAEMLPSVWALSRVEKLRLIQHLAEDLTRVEETAPFTPNQSYPISSLDRAFDAAAALLRELEAGNTRQCPT
jgi:hypothetical protein